MDKTKDVEQTAKQIVEGKGYRDSDVFMLAQHITRQIKNIKPIPDDVCGICYHPKSECLTCHHPECPTCKKCYGTGWLHGCQNWSEKFIRKHGTPYYSRKCDCQKTDLLG